MLRKTAVAGVSLAVTLAGLVLPASLAAAAPASAARAGGQPPAPAAKAVAAADRAVRSGLDALAKGPHEQYDRHQVTPWVKGLYSVAYQRTYEGLPVVGGDAVVLADGDGGVRAVQSATTARISVSTEPTVTAARAARTSRARLARVEKAAPGRLVVRVRNDTATLAWETVLTGRTKAHVPSRLHVFVDARTGKVVDSYDDVRAGSGTSKWNGPSPLTIDTSRSGSGYVLRDTTRPGLQCSDYSGGVFTKSTDNWGTGNPTSKETGCVDAMFAAQKESDMLKNWLGRNGHDGNGGSWPVRVGLNDLNAYWDGSTISIGHNSANEWIAGIDVVGHEFGHGLDTYTPGGDNHESGLGEATGDIMGALTEAYANEPAPYDTPDYTVGEMIDLQGRGPIRNMYDPSRVNNDPRCYSASIPSTEEHAAAGPLNHWFYLLAEGSSPGGGKPSSPTCDNSTVTGVGIQAAGRIFYGGMLLKTSGMTYKRYRTATLTSAKNLDASCGLYNATKAAWDAVSVPAQPGDPTCTGQQSDFSLSLDPAAGTVDAGAFARATVGTTTVTGSAQQISLTASGAPAGVNVSFSPATVTSGGSATMTVSTSAATSAGTYAVTVTGSGGGRTHTARYTLTVGGGGTGPGTPPDVDVAKVQAHLAQLNTIATQNGGNRRSTTAGYRASLAYVKGKLQAAGYTVTEQSCTSGCTPGAGNNLIAEWPQGDANSVYMFGAHLDSVSAGPGINDNGSGSATLLETALTLAQANPAMKNRVRFAWWTDEEQGLNGSGFYARSLSGTDRARIKAYYNFDMVASTNAGYFVNNLNSAAAAPMKAYWDSLGLAPQENVEGQGRSDDYSFQQVGIPTSGYATGADAVKSASEAAKWGGTAGRSYDSCYHSACDTTGNINATALNRSADGVAYTIWKTAVGDTPVPGDDFSISANPAAGTVRPGSSASVTVSTATTGGAAQNVRLSASGAPSGVSVSFSPASVTSGQSSTATVQVAADVAGGTYTLTITGTGTATHTTTYTLTVPGGGGQTSWQAGATYAPGDVVTYDGVSYRCIQGHTAYPGWEPPNVPALWQRI